MNVTIHRVAARRQTGSTLVVSLLILMLIMILGVTAMTNSDTQFRLAGNVQFEDSAMNNAEMAIASAEDWLTTGNNFRSYTTLPTALNDPFDFSTGTITTVNANAAYRIELITLNSQLIGSSLAVGQRNAPCNKVNTFLITARGLSARGATKFVQSYFSVLSC